MSERTEAEVLLETFTGFHGNRIADALIAVAAKVRELDAPGHATETERAYIRGWRDRDAGSAWSPKPPQPPKPKTDPFLPEAHAIYQAFLDRGRVWSLVDCEIAAQATPNTGETE